MAYGSGLPRCFPTLTYQCSPRCQHLVASAETASIIFDLGAGGRRVAPNVTTIDVQPFPDTDVVASVYQLPIRNESSDLVFATGLLEHLEDERQSVLKAAVEGLEVAQAVEGGDGLVALGVAQFDAAIRCDLGR